MEDQKLYNERMDGYPELESLIKSHFSSIISSGAPLFTTNLEYLFDVFLENIPKYARQHYTCHACRSFVNRYGGLVTISDNGTMTPVMWNLNATPEFFVPAVEAMVKAISKSKVHSVFITSDKVLGQPKTGAWTHMAAFMPLDKVHHSRVHTAGQVMAEKREDFRILISSLLEYSLDTVNTALNLLESETLYRSDRVLGVAKWFKKVHEARSLAPNSRAMENVTWLAVAKAPSGFCHIKSSMIGTLLDDIVAGLSFESIQSRFAEKMNPSNYMRAQTTPTQNSIDQATKLVQKMGIEGSLRRRYAMFNEIPYFLWKPQNPESKQEAKSYGVFDHLSPKNSAPASNNVPVPTTVMTWDKFQRTILPNAESLEVSVDNANRFMALVTAADETAPNILQWDNTFSWYYHGGIDGEIKRRVESAGGRYTNNEIRASLVWEGYTDLDLHVVTPTGDHLYYGQKRVNGGRLDVDANGGSPTTMTPVENIRWSEHAPHGRYRFYVRNYHERSKGSTPFTVELEIGGKVYRYSGIAGGTGWEQDIFVFNYDASHQPQLIGGQSFASDDTWGVPVNSFVKVSGITSSPNLWGENSVVHSGTHVFFLLDGCKDTSEGKGRGFFVETLKPDLREIRKTLELYTASTPIEGVENASACGVGYSKDNEWNLVIKVRSNGSTRLIKIDRWD